MKALQQQISSSSSSSSQPPRRAYNARIGLQTDSLDALDAHGASSSSACPSSGMWIYSLDRPPRERQQQGSPTTQQNQQHSAVASSLAAAETAGSDRLSFPSTPHENNEDLQTEHVSGGFPARHLATHLARYAGGRSFASSKSSSSKSSLLSCSSNSSSSSSRFWGSSSSSSRNSSSKLLHCDLHSEQQGQLAAADLHHRQQHQQLGSCLAPTAQKSRASRTGSLPAELSQQHASPSPVNVIHTVEDAEVAAITAAGSAQPHQQQQHLAHQQEQQVEALAYQCYRIGRVSAPPKLSVGSSGCCSSSNLVQRSCSAAAEGAAAGVPAFQSIPFAAGPQSTAYTQPGLGSTHALQRVRQVQSALPDRVQISTALKQQLIVERATSPHLLPHTSNRSSTLLSGVPDSFGGLDLDPPVANLTLQDAAGVKGGLLHGFAGVGDLLMQVQAPASPRVVVLPASATQHRAAPHSPTSPQRWSPPPARARGPAAAAAAAGDHPVSPGHSGQQQVVQQQQTQQCNKVQQLCAPSGARASSSSFAHLLERNNNGPSRSLPVSPDPQACCASPQGSIGWSRTGSGTGADTGKAEDSRGRTRERSSAARCLRVVAGPEHAGDGGEQQQQQQQQQCVSFRCASASPQSRQDGYQHSSSSMTRNRYSRSLSRSASRAVKGSQDGYSACDNADGSCSSSSNRHGVPGRAAREAHRAVEPLGPLDLDPTAPVLVDHKLSQPDFNDVDYIVHRWSHRWQCDRTMQAASAVPSAAAAAGGCLPQQQQHCGIDCPASPAPTNSSSPAWVRPLEQLQLFGASPVDMATYSTQQRR